MGQAATTSVVLAVRAVVVGQIAGGGGAGGPSVTVFVAANVDRSAAITATLRAIVTTAIVIFILSLRVEATH